MLYSSPGRQPNRDDLQCYLHRYVVTEVSIQSWKSVLGRLEWCLHCSLPVLSHHINPAHLRRLDLKKYRECNRYEARLFIVLWKRVRKCFQVWYEFQCAWSRKLQQVSSFTGENAFVRFGESISTGEICNVNYWNNGFLADGCDLKTLPVFFKCSLKNAITAEAMVIINARCRFETTMS